MAATSTSVSALNEMDSKVFCSWLQTLKHKEPDFKAYKELETVSI